MGLVVRVRNLSRLQAKVKKLNWGIQAGVIQGLRAVGEPMAEDVRQSIRTGARSGRWVTRENPTRKVRASAPGEVPANDRGLLAGSIDVDVDPVQFNLVLSAGAPYARDLEYGHEGAAPRPFLRPALARWRQRIIDAMHDAIKEGTKV